MHRRASGHGEAVVWYVRQGTNSSNCGIAPPTNQAATSSESAGSSSPLPVRLTRRDTGHMHGVSSVAGRSNSIPPAVQAFGCFLVFHLVALDEGVERGLNLSLAFALNI